MLTTLLVAGALAADWPMLQGTEAGRPDTPFQPWGFAQVVGEGVVGAEPATGLSDGLAAHEGDLASFNTVGSGASWAVTLRRARLAGRGAVPGTEQRIAWSAAAELGDNAVTRTDAAVLVDGSVTFSYIPGLRVRVGRFKLPMAEETLEANPLAAEFVDFSAAALTLLESRVADGAYVGGANGFRDTGIQAFDTLAVGPWEARYAVMLSDGAGTALEVDDPKDVTARLALARTLGERGGAHSPEVAVFAWTQRGERPWEGEQVARVRQGAGVHLEVGKLRARAEAIDARGMIETGTNPPFPGQPVAVAPDGHAVGGALYGRWDFGAVAFGVRYDTLWRQIEDDAALRVFHTVTPGVRWEPSPRARVQLDYAFRSLSAPHASEDAQRIAATLGDKLVLQATANF